MKGTTVKPFLMLVLVSLIVFSISGAQEAKKSAAGNLRSVISVQSNKDSIFANLASLSADVYQYRIHPKPHGGGGKTFVGYNLTPKGPLGKSNTNAVYKVVSVTDSAATLIGVSKIVRGASIAITIKGTGAIDTPIIKGFE